MGAGCRESSAGQLARAPDLVLEVSVCGLSFSVVAGMQEKNIPSARKWKVIS